LFGDFEVETPSTENEFKEKTVQKNEVSVSPVSEINKLSLSSYQQESTILIERAKKIILIENDNENVLARDFGKELNTKIKEINDKRLAINRPLNDEIKSNNDLGKQICEPMEKELDRIKAVITNYEKAKELLRLDELRKLEEERKKKDELQRIDMERVNKIKNQISQLRTSTTEKINGINQLKDIEVLESQIKGSKLKPEFYMEFMPDANQMIKDLLFLIEGRKPIIKELEAKKDEANKLMKKNAEEATKQKELIAQQEKDMKDKSEREAALKKAQDDADEFSARQKVTVLVASLGIKNVEHYMDKLIAMFGNFRSIMQNSHKVVENYQNEQKELAKLAELEDQKMKNQRVDYHFQILDESKVPMEYYSIDEKKIKEAIKNNKLKLDKDVNSFTIDGILIFAKTQTVLKD
jgi:hypothetical protein